MARSIAALLLAAMLVSCVPRTGPEGTPAPTLPLPASGEPGRPSPSLEVPPPVN